jgi:hypothetical protein
MDSHWIWRIVGNNYAAMRKESPDGHVPQVLVSLAGYAEPLPIGFAQTNPERDWTMLQLITGEEDDDPATAYPGDRLVFVRPEHVLSIELRYVPERRAGPVGFVYREVSGDDLTA